MTLANHSNVRGVASSSEGVRRVSSTPASEDTSLPSLADFPDTLPARRRAQTTGEEPSGSGMTGDGLTNSVSESEGATSAAAGRQRSLARQPSPAERGEGHSSRSHSPPFRQLQGCTASRQEFCRRNGCPPACWMDYGCDC
ncbi:unnamed protein product [Vitrella brassicaformis CCMP3155]|uniref:Uncharacterized protein n=1 Tax=Vitrella brassicaformis (strain CCMP3155) TaxID=1169540 RepID=A0A0G4GD69_VITBC|nr:unnamed protein product [Vitrella brassicaformis CCMP3155]|eukprot:CEM27204.1 unnamed protein product [Vitrella brassicaformis CCMP3155]